ncbi:16S rRNA (adenine(1518)-N(6)/adenine(1519)-N(6))-dimethyltransferase, partial [Nocardioides sp.]
IAGSADAAEAALRTAGVDPLARGESLGIEEFVAVTVALSDSTGSDAEGEAHDV